MKKKVFFLVLAGAIAFAVLLGVEAEMDKPRSPASAVVVPTSYETMKAQEKVDLLWDEVKASVHMGLPAYRKFGLMQLLGMSIQELQIKGKSHTDFAPIGWKKYLHRRGAIAKVKIVSKGSKYTGIFQGADSALLRLSLTYKTAGDKPVAPGLALKILRDGVHSANISALVSLNGQGKDFNFFKHPMSNIVPPGDGVGQKLVHKLFSRVTKYPEELVVSDMATMDAKGAKPKDMVSPRQIFFVPNDSLHFASTDHDVRLDFLTVPEGTTIYKIYALPNKFEDYDYSKYTENDIPVFIKESEHIADIVTTSEFLASDFGDDGIFFRHQLRP